MELKFPGFKLALPLEVEVSLEVSQALCARRGDLLLGTLRDGEEGQGSRPGWGDAHLGDAESDMPSAFLSVKRCRAMFSGPASPHEPGGDFCGLSLSVTHPGIQEYRGAGQWGFQGHWDRDECMRACPVTPHLLSCGKLFPFWTPAGGREPAKPFAQLISPCDPGCPTCPCAHGTFPQCQPGQPRALMGDGGPGPHWEW